MHAFQPYVTKFIKTHLLTGITREAMQHYYKCEYRKAIELFPFSIGFLDNLKSDILCQAYFHFGDSFTRISDSKSAKLIFSLGLRKALPCNEIMLLNEGLRLTCESKYADINYNILSNFDGYFPNIDRVFHGISWTLGIMKKQPEFSIEILNKCLERCQYEVELCRTSHGLGDAFRAKEDWVNAVKWHTTALDLSDKFKDIRYLTLIDMSRSLIRLGHLDEAEAALLEGLELIEDDKYYFTFAHMMLSEIYRERDDKPNLKRALFNQLAYFKEHSQKRYLTLLTEYNNL